MLVDVKFFKWSSIFLQLRLHIPEETFNFEKISFFLKILKNLTIFFLFFLWMSSFVWYGFISFKRGQIVRSVTVFYQTQFFEFLNLCLNFKSSNQTNFVTCTNCCICRKVERKWRLRAIRIKTFFLDSKFKISISAFSPFHWILESMGLLWSLLLKSKY